MLVVFVQLAVLLSIVCTEPHTYSCKVPFGVFLSFCIIILSIIISEGYKASEFF